MAGPVSPETYYLVPTSHVPNSHLPVLVYRSVLSASSSLTPQSIKSQIEPNHWLIGGQWKAYGAAHFHSVTHECYAVFSGSSRIRLGVGPLDMASLSEDDQSKPSPISSNSTTGIDIEMTAGDIVVLPVCELIDSPQMII